MKQENYINKSEDRSGVDQIYSEEKLDLDAIKKNPILKPISELNNSYVNFELLINRALWEFGEIKSEIDSMIELNPKYSETMLLGKVQSLLGHIKQIIHAQDIQKENMKSTIHEMIRIVKDNYGVLDEDNEPIPEVKKPIIEVNKKTETIEENLNKDIPVDKVVENEEDKNNTPKNNEENKDKYAYSELVEREIKKPNNLDKDGGFIPLN